MMKQTTLGWGPLPSHPGTPFPVAVASWGIAFLSLLWTSEGTRVIKEFSSSEEQPLESLGIPICS